MSYRTQFVQRAFNRDIMHMLSRDRAAVVAHEMLASVNALRPEEQAVAASVLFAVLARRLKLDPEEFYHLGLKLLERPHQFHRKGNGQMEALEAYADLQLTGRI